MTEHDSEAIVIGLDLGTTSTKAVAFTVSGDQLATASHGYPLDTPHPGHAVQDPEKILAAAYAAVNEVVTEVGADRVAGISFSSAMHSLLGLDASGSDLVVDPDPAFGPVDVAGLVYRGKPVVL